MTAKGRRWSCVTMHVVW